MTSAMNCSRALRLFALVAVLGAAVTDAKTCHSTVSTDGWGVANQLPILDGNGAMKFVNSSKHFKVFCRRWCSVFASVSLANALHILNAALRSCCSWHWSH